MTARNDHASGSDILETLAHRAGVAVDTQLQAADLVETKYVRLQFG